MSKPSKPIMLTTSRETGLQTQIQGDEPRCTEMSGLAGRSPFRTTGRRARFVAVGGGCAVGAGGVAPRADAR